MKFVGLLACSAVCGLSAAWMLSVFSVSIESESTPVVTVPGTTYPLAQFSAEETVSSTPLVTVQQTPTSAQDIKPVLSGMLTLIESLLHRQSLDLTEGQKTVYIKNDEGIYDQVDRLERQVFSLMDDSSDGDVEVREALTISPTFENPNILGDLSLTGSLMGPEGGVLAIQSNRDMTGGNFWGIVFQTEDETGTPTTRLNIRRDDIVFYNSIVTSQQPIYASHAGNRVLTMQGSSNSASPGQTIIQPDGGSVGIGTTTPTTRLTVAGSIGASTFCDENGNNCASVTALTSGTSPWSTSGSNISYVGGNVAIGTSTPISELHVHDETGSGHIWISAGGIADSRGAYLTLDDRVTSGADDGMYRIQSVNGLFNLVGINDDFSVRNRPLTVDSDGNIGIGTTTPSQQLTVAGNGLLTGSLTASIIDQGGQVCDVRAYGAVGDNSTINDAAIAAAIADCPEGGTVYFPMGEFRISQPIVLDRPVTLRGAYSPRWSYSSTPRSSIRADFGSFAGVAMVHVRDRTISGEPNHNNGGRLEHIMLDGGSAGTDVTGIYFEGLVRDWKLTDVDISQTTGNGFEAAVGTGEGNPRGFTIRGLSIYSADGHGFRATALNDSFIDDLLAVGNALRGIYISSMGETKIANSRAVFNALEGLYVDGSSNNGGITFTDFSTDRNDRHGVRISASGTSTIIFNGLLTRRDGPNLGGGSETPYAGVAIIGSPAEKVAPVFISGLGQTVGVDDSGNPPLSPSVGVRVTNAEYVKVDGQLWGIDESWRDDGGNDYFIIEDDAILKTGTAGAQELFTSNRSWQATSSNALVFDGKVNIGSSTDTRLFNIVGESGVASRLRDTTNNVIMDTRVEDFQAFIGTFSNHQVRFMSNNTSRLTIDLNGNIGIGTTSPSAQLTVVDDVRFASITGGSLQTDALGNVTVSSDERLKNIEGDYDIGLAELLELDPIMYRWASTTGYDTEGLYAGFSAQNVAAVIPTAVGENPDGFLTLSDRPILAAVVNAVQDIWDALSEYVSRTEQLEAIVAEQQERIEALEAELDIEAAPTPPPTPATTTPPTTTPQDPVVETESTSATSTSTPDSADSATAVTDSTTAESSVDESEAEETSTEVVTPEPQPVTEPQLTPQEVTPVPNQATTETAEAPST